MKVSNPLDKILDNAAKVKILRFLVKTNAEWNGRQIARAVGVTPATAHKALQGLNREGVLLLRNMGKTHVYTLNNNFTVINMLKPLFTREKEILARILRVIRRKIAISKIRDAIVTVALFGSVSRQKDHPVSDIDLLVIIKDLKAGPGARRLFDEIDKKIAREFGNSVSPYISTEMEFKAKYKKGLALIRNILKSHRLIYGKQLERII